MSNITKRTEYRILEAWVSVGCKESRLGNDYIMENIRTLGNSIKKFELNGAYTQTDKQNIISSYIRNKITQKYLLINWKLKIQLKL